jgi:shikimate kinase
MIEGKIYLMGFMSSGKSSLGKKLARHLNRTFVDLDQRIEAELGRSIPEIFKEEGEEAFRKYEAQQLTSIPEVDQQMVISLGGGTPCFGDNLDYIKAQGSSVYLRVSEDILIGRLRQKKASRPLISDKSDEEIAEFVRQTLRKREPYYLQADYILASDHPKVESVLNLLKLS